MPTVLIDTHDVVKHLIASGFSEKQAEGVCEAIEQIDLSHLATKSDLSRMENELHKSFEALRHEVKAELSNFKAELFKWLLPLMLGQAGLTTALVKLL